MSDTASSQRLGGPLDGIIVLDFTNVLSGPYCTRLLADLGADVIKVETKEGDHNRHRPPLRSGRSTVFGHVNCGKRSIVLDLKTEPGRKAAVELGMKADVIVENWRPGVADRLGVGYRTFAERRPELIYCSISGYGQSGPKAQLPAYAHILHAASGVDMAQMAHDRAASPPRTGIYIADVLSGLVAFSAIQSALFQRERTGCGQLVDVAMIDCMLNLPIFELQLAQFAAPSRRIMRPLRASDGFVCIAPFNNRIFSDMMTAIGHPEWREDPRFKREPDRDVNWDEMMNCVETWTRERSAAECERILMGGGVPCARYRTVSDALTDEHLLMRRSLVEVEDKSGAYWIANTPFQMPKATIGARSRVAELGEDTAAVLRDMLGYDEPQIRACRSE